MENEFDQDDVNPNNPNKVRISITRASFSEDESDLESPGKPRPRADSDSSIDEQEMEKMMQEDEQNENEQLHNGGEKSDEHNNHPSSHDVVNDSRTDREDEEVTKAFENGVTISNENDTERSESAGKLNDEPNESLQSNNKEDSPQSPPTKSPAMEMIGDRVLIERDGKFELVDVSEIKAEYYDMLGIAPENNDENIESEETGSETSEKNAKEIEDEKKSEPVRPRPKTTSVQELQRRNEKKRTARGVDRTRSQSAKAIRQRNDDYAHIRSEYAMTEQQLEIRRKCKEAKLRRQKEEQEREREEQQRKREDADRAFQAWLYAKVESAHQARLNQPDPNADKQAKEARESDAQSAYSEWLDMKRKQDKAFRQLEGRRRADEASQYAIRDRQLCDEAFRRWLKKKKHIEELKNAAKKKKRKPKLKRKEQPPLNSHKNRYYEYYGYRNNVVL